MPMTMFDEMVPQDMSALLQPGGQQPQGPMMGGQGAGDSFAAMLAGGSPNPQAQVPQTVQAPMEKPQAQPGLLDGARGWLMQNPKMAQMLMTSFAALAGSGDIGKAVQAGAMSGFAYDQEDYNRQQAEKKLKSEEEMQNRKLGLEERRTVAAEEDAVTNREYRRAVTEGQELENRDKEATAGTRSKKLQREIDLIDVKIRHADTEVERAKLQTRMDKLKLDLEKEYGAADRQGVIDQRAAATGASMVQTDRTRQTMAHEQQVQDFMKGLPAEEYKNAMLGIKPKAGKSAQEQFQDFVVKSRVANPEADLNTLWKEFQQIQTAGQPGAAGPADKEKAAWDKARNSVQVGKTYIGPDGKPYVRRN